MFRLSKLEKIKLLLNTFFIRDNFKSFSKVESHKTFSSVKIKNFGQMDERFYRGAQPKKEDFPALRTLGINTIINLRDIPKNYEKSIVEGLGMGYFNIQMSDKKYPTPTAIETFMKIVDDPSTGVFYVHCAGGRHRTGVVGAIYRFIKYGWGFDQVYKEMWKYDFYTRWGHAPLKDFVSDYAEKMKIESAAFTRPRPAILQFDR